MNLKQMRSHLHSYLVRAKQDVSHLGPGKDWTDEELNAKLNEAYRMFLNATEMLRETANVTVTDGVGDAPTGLISIKRVEIDSRPAETLAPNTFPEDLPV